MAKQEIFEKRITITQKEKGRAFVVVMEGVWMRAEIDSAYIATLKELKRKTAEELMLRRKENEDGERTSE